MKALPNDPVPPVTRMEEPDRIDMRASLAAGCVVCDVVSQE
jgi:hypothetical protein